MRFQYRDIGEIKAIRRAIEERKMDGWLSPAQYEAQVAILKELTQEAMRISPLRRHFARRAPKGEDTLRYLDEQRGLRMARPGLNSIEWLCKGRVYPQGFVAAAAVADLQAWKDPVVSDLYVLKNETGSILAILDDRSWQEPLKGTYWQPGIYFVMYVRAGFDPATRTEEIPDPSLLPNLDDWINKTSRQLTAQVNAARSAAAEGKKTALLGERHERLNALIESVESGYDPDERWEEEVVYYEDL